MEVVAIISWYKPELDNVTQIIQFLSTAGILGCGYVPGFWEFNLYPSEN